MLLETKGDSYFASSFSLEKNHRNSSFHCFLFTFKRRLSRFWANKGVSLSRVLLLPGRGPPRARSVGKGGPSAWQQLLFSFDFVYICFERYFSANKVIGTKREVNS